MRSAEGKRHRRGGHGQNRDNPGQHGHAGRDPFDEVIAPRRDRPQPGAAETSAGRRSARVDCMDLLDGCGQETGHQCDEAASQPDELEGDQGHFVPHMRLGPNSAPSAISRAGTADGSWPQVKK
jgi:hypothetical protein